MGKYPTEARSHDDEILANRKLGDKRVPTPIVEGTGKHRGGATRLSHRGQDEKDLAIYELTDGETSIVSPEMDSNTDYEAAKRTISQDNARAWKALDKISLRLKGKKEDDEEIERVKDPRGNTSYDATLEEHDAWTPSTLMGVNGIEMTEARADEGMATGDEPFKKPEDPMKRVKEVVVKRPSQEGEIEQNQISMIQADRGKSLKSLDKISLRLKEGFNNEKGVTRQAETTDHARTGSAQNEQYSGEEGVDQAVSEEEPLEELTDGELTEVEKPVKKDTKKFDRTGDEMTDIANMEEARLERQRRRHAAGWTPEQRSHRRGSGIKGIKNLPTEAELDKRIAERKVQNDKKRKPRFDILFPPSIDDDDELKKALAELKVLLKAKIKEGDANPQVDEGGQPYVSHRGTGVRTSRGHNDVIPIGTYSRRDSTARIEGDEDSSLLEDAPEGIAGDPKKHRTRGTFPKGTEKQPTNPSITPTTWRHEKTPSTGSGAAFKSLLETLKDALDPNAKPQSDLLGDPDTATVRNTRIGQKPLGVIDAGETHIDYNTPDNMIGGDKKLQRLSPRGIERERKRLMNQRGRAGTGQSDSYTREDGGAYDDRAPKRSDRESKQKSAEEIEVVKGILDNVKERLVALRDRNKPKPTVAADPKINRTGDKARKVRKPKKVGMPNQTTSETSTRQPVFSKKKPVYSPSQAKRSNTNSVRAAAGEKPLQTPKQSNAKREARERKTAEELEAQNRKILEQQATIQEKQRRQQMGLRS